MLTEQSNKGNTAFVRAVCRDLNVNVVELVEELFRSHGGQQNMEINT